MGNPRHNNNSVYDPHPRSKLAFAFQVLEAIDQVLVATKNCPAQTLYEDAAAAERDGNPGVAARLKYCARNAEPIDDAWRSIARDELFPPPERPGSAADEARVVKHAKVLRAAAVQHEAGATLLKALAETDKPKKRPVAEEIIVGCYFSLPDHLRTLENAARVLRDGTPTGDERLGIDRHAVAYHLSNFVKRACMWPVDRWPGYFVLRHHVTRWRRVEYLWNQLGARRSGAAVAELIESGQIFGMLDVFEDSDDPTRAAIGDMTRRIIAELEKAPLHKCA